MAELIINDKKNDIADGESIASLCEQEGVIFSCNNGVCGSCQIKILEGAENLSELTEEEKAFGMDLHTRLACMVCIQKGIVKITF